MRIRRTNRLRRICCRGRPWIPQALSAPETTPANVVATRILSNQMIEAMDTEIGNLMVSAGLARRLGNGTIDYRPEETNTMVIIIGDNGTYAPGVKVPFDLNRAKGYVYQTGVWVPLIVAGPLVDSPDREVKSMISIADLFQLFGEIAGADVHKVVPSSHILDSQPMLAYLTHPNQPEHSHDELHADGEQHSSHGSASLRHSADDSADVHTAGERTRALPLRRRQLVRSQS